MNEQGNVSKILLVPTGDPEEAAQHLEQADTAEVPGADAAGAATGNQHGGAAAKHC